jgi:hypothetical protein
MGCFVSCLCVVPVFFVSCQVEQCVVSCSILLVEAITLQQAKFCLTVRDPEDEGITGS